MNAMAGYYGYSKSNNAIDAEERGLMTASRLARRLGVSASIVSQFLTPKEWHHTSKFYNATDYYDPNVSEALILEMKRAHKSEKNQREIYRADVEYIKWSGSRRNPYATRFAYQDILVEESGSFYIIHTPVGVVRKKKYSTGTSVIRSLNHDHPWNDDHQQDVAGGSSIHPDR